MQSKSKTYLQSEAEKAEQRKRQLISWAILLGVIALVVVITVIVSSLSTGGSSISALPLPCYADQKVTVFQDGVLYYDSASIHFVNAGGGIEWSYPAGDGASFATSDTHLIVWRGRQLAIVDAKGTSFLESHKNSPFLSLRYFFIIYNAFMDNTYDFFFVFAFPQLCQGLFVIK